MPAGLIGRKLGMMRIFGDDGSVVPVSVIEAQPNSITRLRTPERDGYAALAGYVMVLLSIAYFTMLAVIGTAAAQSWWAG